MLLRIRRQEADQIADVRHVRWAKSPALPVENPRIPKDGEPYSVQPD